jgi:hypothetical protein
MKYIAAGCAAIFLVCLVAVWALGPVVQEAAHRRELGRGTQTFVEFFFPLDGLYDDLATACGDIAVGDVVFEQDVTLKYAGPYAIDLRTTNPPPMPLPDWDSDPKVVVLITPPNSDPIVAETRKFEFPFWGRDHGLTLHHFDTPGEIPLDQPVNFRVVVERPPNSFVELYGSAVEVVLRRRSSE